MALEPARDDADGSTTGWYRFWRRPLASERAGSDPSEGRDGGTGRPESGEGDRGVSP